MAERCLPLDSSGTPSYRIARTVIVTFRAPLAWYDDDVLAKE